MNPIDQEVAKILSDCPLKSLTPQEEQNIHVAIQRRADEIQQVLNVWESGRQRNRGKKTMGEQMSTSCGFPWTTG